MPRWLWRNFFGKWPDSVWDLDERNKTPTEHEHRDLQGKDYSHVHGDWLEMHTHPAEDARRLLGG